jgi:alanyl-tRNA synthetase
MKSSEIRKEFLKFFADKKHNVVKSAPMVIKNDPTLMFTNAGMNQFKEHFLGNSKPVNERVCNTQKCLRVSGKHNDLEEVGIDTYHHTFFEMLGNWSFGDYFKEEAINWAWELLTVNFKIPVENLYVTVFEGSKEGGLDKDLEAYNFWNKIVSNERILLGNKNDNFWEMGDQGPCGPCSEIHIDLRSENDKKKVAGSSLVNKDNSEVIELWNLVFIEFNRKADGSLEKLPAKHIDTGLGFERLCMVLQNKKSNYDSDVFTPLIREIELLTNFHYGKEEVIDRAIRVVSDHIRAVYFSIADGQLPSNNGAGYVIRRILRRAIRYGFTFLNQKEPFIYKLVSTLENQLESVFSELSREKNLAFNVIREEEKSFLKTLDQGLTLLDNIISSSKSEIISGSKCFQLYDTYGFPIDLTALIASERGYSIETDEFDKEMNIQKKRSRAASLSSSEDWVVLESDYFEEFVGYDYLSTDVKITRYRKITSVKDGNFYQLVFNLTPFYPEGGGQVGDKGYLQSLNGDIFYIVDTKKENNVILHYTKNLPSNLKEVFKAVVDSKQRTRTSSNHTATHILHQALRSVLGDHVEQKGSRVHSEIFRFDFSHFSKLKTEELIQIEQFVNSRIMEHIPLEENRNELYKEAINKGAIGLFGEKYEDVVRTIKFGQSYELCGGTHVKNTHDIWHLKILSETSIASGIRRIEAITADAVKDHFEKRNDLVEELENKFNKPKDLIKTIEKIREENTSLKKELLELTQKNLKNIENELNNSLIEKNKLLFLAKEVDLDSKNIKNLAFLLGKNKDNLLLVLASNKGGKPIISCYISKELVNKKNINAIELVRVLGKYIGGSGGGQSFFATSGGKDPKGIKKALAEAELISNKLK